MITGRVEILANAKLLLSKPGAVASGIGVSGEPGTELTPIFSDRLDGFTETGVPARLDVTITDRDDISLSEIAKIFENGTIIFQAAGSGKSYIMTKATCLKNLSLTSGQGEVSLSFVGPYWMESTQ